MKKVFYSIIILLLTQSYAFAQQTISGIVFDENAQPLVGVNVFIKETFEGASSDLDGRFSFLSDVNASVTLCAMMLGYETYEHKGSGEGMSDLIIRMRPTAMFLDGVTVTASIFQLKGSSQFEGMNAVEIVTTAGSAGDLYGSLATMPGTQAVGESGRLFVRGGESREVQTYIDDMRVLNPYTTTAANEPVRGRYSPFMFDGMNFSLGGYDSEYAQGLSSVLPLYTKDESLVSKYGVNFSSVGAGGGGTYSADKGSVSVSLDYQNLAPYFSVVPNSRDWASPYQLFNGGAQFRYNPDRKSVLKLYTGYDRTTFSINEDSRRLKLDENNAYLNATYKHELYSGYNLFGGAAFSGRSQAVGSAISAGDKVGLNERELHLKLKLYKRYSSLFKMQAGVETMRLFSEERYDGEVFNHDEVSHSVDAIFATGSFYLSDKLNMVVSSRLEHTSFDGGWNFNPRLVVNYKVKQVDLSAILGRYTQLSESRYLYRSQDLSAESCIHYIFGAYHQSGKQFYRAEAYYKKYDNLALVENGVLSNGGYGYSKGLDFFYSNESLFRNLECRLSYSLNLSERKYQDYPVFDVPQYASRHNASVVLKYNVQALRSIVGVTNRVASGRPYHNPNKDGFMNAYAPSYNSLDLSITYLASKKVIVYASASNLFGRRNIYDYTYDSAPDANGVYAGKPVKTASRNFFFVGVFITLGGNTAYDVSNF